MKKFFQSLAILFVWIGIIFCSVYCGLFFSRVGMPENFVFMAVSIIGSVFLVWVHKAVTSDWELPEDPWVKFHVPLFWGSLVVSCVGLLMAIIVKAPAEITVSLISAILFFYIAERTESNYVVWI